MRSGGAERDRTNDLLSAISRFVSRQTRRAAAHNDGFILMANSVEAQTRQQGLRVQGQQRIRDHFRHLLEDVGLVCAGRRGGRASWKLRPRTVAAEPAGKTEPEQ